MFRAVGFQGNSGVIQTLESEVSTPTAFVQDEIVTVSLQLNVLDEAKHHCNDEMDNDEDGYVDDADPDCASGYEELGFGETQCNDGIDNNGDGTLDAEDSNCESAADEQIGHRG